MTYKINYDNFFMSIDGAVADGELANQEATIYLNTTSKDVVMRYRDDVGTLRTAIVGESSAYVSGQILFGDTDGSITSSADLTYDSSNNRIDAGSPSSSVVSGVRTGIYSGTGHTVGATTAADDTGIVGGSGHTINSQDQAFIGGGLSNTIQGTGTGSAIIGGNTNEITTGTDVFIAGGNNNTNTSGNESVIVGGNNNTVASSCSAIIGGNGNNANAQDSAIIASRISTTSGVAIVGSSNNSTSGGVYSVILASNACSGTNNHNAIIGSNASTIANGLRSGIYSGATHNIGTTSGGDNSVIIGGSINTIDVHDNGFIGGGTTNSITGAFSAAAIVGGFNNSITSGNYSFVGGGRDITISAANSGTLGGNNNSVTANESAIVGGQNNDISGQCSGILAGDFNSITGADSAIVGGRNGTITGASSVVLGGNQNIATAARCIVGGRYAGGATNDTFILNLDASATVAVNSTVAESFCVLAVGGAVFGSASSVASAELAVDSTTKGFRIPKMTTAQMNAIASPDSGLQIFDTTTSQFMGYNGSAWIILG